MGLVAAADMEVGLVAAKTELEVWLVWKEEERMWAGSQ